MEDVDKTGIFKTLNKDVKGFDPWTAEVQHYDINFIRTEDPDKSVGYVAKSNGVTFHYLRFGSTLVDQESKKSLTDNKFLRVDEEIFTMYRAYLEKGNYAGFVGANNLIRQKGFV